MRTHRVIFGDSQRMPELADESVHLAVTSPPYWCIKDYAHPGQIGYEHEYIILFRKLGKWPKPTGEQR